MTEADLELYTKQFTTSGFTGPINWYRNLDANFDIFDSIGAEPLTMPTFFIAGDLDPVILGRPEYLARMNADLPNHQATELIKVLATGCNKRPRMSSTGSCFAGLTRSEIRLPLERVLPIGASIYRRPQGC
jgi:hypothetical protein